MDIIKCVVRGQKLSVNVPVMADLTLMYFNLSANFDSTWDKYTQRWVHIHKKDDLSIGSDWVLDSNNQIASTEGINLENGEWEIWLHGVEFIPGSTTVRSRITTEIKYFKVLATGTDGGFMPDVPESNVAQITAIAQNALDIVTDLEARADTGEFQGEQGPAGPQGPQGEPGETGPQGPQGERGLTGPAGADGPQGPQGIQGPEGPIGKSFTVIDTLPSVADLPDNPEEGDAYGVGTEPPYHVYMYGATSGWVDYGVIIQGPPGPTGAQGPQGLQGIQGETGPQGPQGVQGIQGEPGPAGATGAQGETGPQGEAGPAGPKGPKGDTGERGPKGDTVDDYVLVQSTEPTSETNKIWVDNSQQTPTYLVEIKDVAAEYDSTVSYAVDSVCSYQGKLYKCDTATSGGAFDPAKWSEVTISEVASSSQVTGDFVSYGEAQTLSSAEKSQARTNIDAEGKWTTLWTNARPSSSFAAQTVALDLSVFAEIGVQVRMNTTSQVVYDWRYFSVGTSSFVRQLLNDGKNLMQRYRSVNTASNGVTFGDCTDVTQGSNGVTNNSGNIPVIIIAR